MESSVIKVISSSAVSAVLLILGLAAPAQALSNRAWVSGHGTDVAGCGSPASPCRTFQYVHDNIIAPSGEIDVLDPAGYGPVTIAKALSIVNDGAGTAGVQQTNGSVAAIEIIAGASDAVYLRGLNVDGLGLGAAGIRLNSGGKLTVVNCVVRHFGGDGISIISSIGVIAVSISATVVSDNNRSGIAFAPFGTAGVTGVISQTTTANNGAGNASSAGISVFNNSPASASVTIVDSAAFNNNTGFQVNNPGGLGTLRLGRSVATGNGNGLFILPGSTLSSYGDNKVDGNTIDVGGPGTLAIIANH
jgi:hypothetical protein